MFNLDRQPPDVISDTYTGSESPTSSVTAVGFRCTYVDVYDIHYKLSHPILTVYIDVYVSVHICSVLSICTGMAKTWMNYLSDRQT